MPTGFYNTYKIYDKYDEFLLSPRAQELISSEIRDLQKPDLSEENIKIIKSSIKSVFVGWMTNTGQGIYNHNKIPIRTPQGEVKINVEESPDFLDKDAFVSWLIKELDSDGLAIPSQSIR